MIPDIKTLTHDVSISADGNALITHNGRFAQKYLLSKDKNQDALKFKPFEFGNNKLGRFAAISEDGKYYAAIDGFENENAYPLTLKVIDTDSASIVSKMDLDIDILPTMDRVEYFQFVPGTNILFFQRNGYFGSKLCRFNFIENSLYTQKAQRIYGFGHTSVHSVLSEIDGQFYLSALKFVTGLPQHYDVDVEFLVIRPDIFKPIPTHFSFRTLRNP